MNNAGLTDKRADYFRFSACRYDPANGKATLSYEVDGQHLEELLTFPWKPWPVDASRQAAFFKALELLHLVAGISYYKAGLAKHVDTGPGGIDETTATFLEELYEKGLGEFAYVNQLDLSGLIKFKVGSRDEPSGTNGHSLDLPERALVAMGGGKDSLVCLKLLVEAGVEVQPICVGGSSLIGETVRVARLPLVRVDRQLSSALSDMNAGGAWNGHVPVTAINSAILLCAALLYGYRHIVFANESSANEATLVNEKGDEVNHQYSKGLAFEKSFRHVIQGNVSPDIEYYSLLRPYGELAIARLFSEMTEFHGVFSSCNRNFHQGGSCIEGRWCCDCPKCRFTALALAPFISPEQLFAIQGADLLDQEKQMQGFLALCGLGQHKPFECVGSIFESRAAIRHLSKQDQWKGKHVIAALADHEEIRQAGRIDLHPDSGAEHCIPDTILASSNAF